MGNTILELISLNRDELISGKELIYGISLAYDGYSLEGILEKIENKLITGRD